MRFVKISAEEMREIKSLYEGVMSYASHGLFFREGCVLGESIGKMAKKGEADFFKTAKAMLVGRGWAEDVEFHFRTVVIHGSIEASFESDAPACHRIRGIVKRLYEINNDRLFECKEVECAATGADQCTFVLEESSF